MFIKSLKLKNFKSFADETTINFSQGINCIVGPNGCGKSNIVDALKWVVGDTSAKGIRADRQKDVIFKGCEGKRAARSAEVSLTLTKNSLFEGKEPLTTITRRVKSNGESEFFINGKKVRLKDVQELLSSIGLGNKDYAFFEQGQIDKILKMKPTERRELIDEAAGITPFKLKKESTLKELEEANQNLENVKGIIEEVGKNLKALKTQAEKAERFKKLREEEKRLETLLYGLQLKNLRATKELAESTLRVLREDRNSLESEIASLQVEIENFRKELEETTKLIEETSQELYEVEKSKKEASVKKEFLSKEIIRIGEEIREKLKEKEIKKERVSKLKEELDRLKEEERRLSEELLKIKEEYSSLTENLNTLLKKERELKDKLSSQRKKLNDTVNLINKLNLDLAREEERQKSQQKLLSSIPSTLETIKKELSYFKEQKKAILEKLGKLKKEKEELLKKLEEKKEEKEELLEKVESLEEEIASTSHQLTAVRSKRESIERILSTLNLGKLEEKIVESGKKGKVKGYIGLLVNLIEVDSGWEKVVESYLERFGAGIVLKTFKDVTWVKERIKGNGRVFLLSAEVDEVKGEYVEEATPLTAHVRARDSRVKNLVNLLFSNVFFVQSGAEELAKKYPKCVFIDKDLNLFSGKGSVVGKFKKSSTLELEKELLSLKGEEEEKRKQLEELKEKLSPLKEELEAIEEQVEEIKEVLRSKEVEIFKIESSIKEVEKETEKREREIVKLKEKEENLRKGVEGFSSKVNLFKSRISSLEEEKKELVKEIKRLEAEVGEIEKKVSEEKEKIGKVNSKETLLKEKISNLKEKIKGKERAVQLTEREIEENEKKVEKLEKKLKKSEEELKKAEKLLEGIDETIEDIREELKRLEEKRRSLTEILTGKEAALKSREKDLKEVEKRLKENEITVAKLSGKEEELIEKILSINSSVSEALELAEESEMGEEEVKRELINVKEKISRIGSVNLLAIEEYGKVKERYQFILEQERDLVNSIKNLKSAIKKLDEEIEKRLTETFNGVNRNFRKAFKTIFGGGKARLLLVGDKISEAGIEIEAKPPGKKHNQINLLSGGEKTLVALAFLYALYSYKPAPFLVLDEVDAALDDVNTARFVELLKQIATETQVIVITHNKITMEAADTLYGITMEIPGISKVLGVSFEFLTAV